MYVCTLSHKSICKARHQWTRTLMTKKSHLHGTRMVKEKQHEGLYSQKLKKKLPILLLLIIFFISNMYDVRRSYEYLEDDIIKTLLLDLRLTTLSSNVLKVGEFLKKKQVKKCQLQQQISDCWFVSSWKQNWNRRCSQLCHNSKHVKNRC